MVRTSADVSGTNPFSACEVRAGARPTSVVHTLGDFGLLHAGSLPDGALNVLRDVCCQTACDAIHTHTTALFDPTTLSLIHLADGYVYYAPSLGNKVLSILKDAHMCVPPGTPSEDVLPISPDGSRSVFYTIVAKRRDAPSAFKLVFHDGYTEPHEISRMSLVDHAIAQVSSSIPLASTSRVIMQSEGLGSLLGQMLSGEDAVLLKRTFMGLIQQSGGASIYNAPIETSRIVARLLQFGYAQHDGREPRASVQNAVYRYLAKRQSHLCQRAESERVYPRQ